MFEWFHGLSLLGISGNTVKKKHYLNDRKIYFTKVLQGLSQIGFLNLCVEEGNHLFITAFAVYGSFRILP